MNQKREALENLHIPLWLLKDTCWMLQWKILGVCMIVPTMSVAVIIAYKSWKDKDDEFWINLAICFWIGVGHEFPTRRFPRVLTGKVARRRKERRHSCRRPKRCAKRPISRGCGRRTRRTPE